MSTLWEKPEAYVRAIPEKVSNEVGHPGYGPNFSWEDHRHEVDTYSIATGSNSAAAGGENLLHNSHARVAQIGNVISGATTWNYHPVDGIQVVLDSVGTWTYSQADIAAPPNEFQAACLTCTSTGTVGANDLGVLVFKIENRRLRPTFWGYPQAKPVTFSAWFYTSVAGTYIFEFLRFASNRMVSVAKTLVAGWQFVVCTFPPDTGGGGHPANSDAGVQIIIVFASGSTYDGGAVLNTTWTTNPTTNTRFVGQVDVVTLNDQILLTEWKLEVGSVATVNPAKSYAEDLAECQRYLQVHVDPKGWAVAGNNASPALGRFGFNLPVTMRANPTVSQSTPLQLYDGANVGHITAIGTNYSNPNAVEVDGSTNMPGGTGSLRTLTSYRGANSVWIVDARL